MFTFKRLRKLKSIISDELRKQIEKENRRSSIVIAGSGLFVSMLGIIAMLIQVY